MLNTVLLGLTGILLSAVGFFLRDLHRKFALLVERVNELHHDHGLEATTGRMHREQNNRELHALKQRVHRLETRLIDKAAS